MDTGTPLYDIDEAVSNASAPIGLISLPSFGSIELFSLVDFAMALAVWLEVMGMETMITINHLYYIRTWNLIALDAIQCIQQSPW